DDLLPGDLAGVDCDLCHRLIDDGVTAPGNALYTIDDMIGPNGDVPKQGPWSYAGPEQPMHSWTVGDLLGRSELCGTRHDVTTDDMIGPNGDVPKQGPWSYAGPEQPMHSWTVGDLLGRSELCGTCHDVTTDRDRVDSRGLPIGSKFNEQRTYSEWLNSAYAVA